jgi:hypothetical protein
MATIVIEVWRRTCSTSFPRTGRSSPHCRPEQDGRRHRFEDRHRAFLPSVYSSFAGIGGGVSVTLMPSVFKILRAFPISQVSLPFSRSMTSRIPVPEVRARSLCVTPRFLRVSRISFPICSGVYLRCHRLKCYRTVILYRLQSGIQGKITVREF